MKEEGRLRVYESRLLRKIFGPKKDWGDWRRLQNEGFYYLFSPYIIQVIKSRRWDGWGVWHVWEMREMCTGLWWGDLRDRDHLEDLCIDGSIILKWIFKKWDREACTGLFWLRTRIGDGPLWMWYWTCVFHKMQGIFWLAKDLLASQVALCCVDLFGFI